MARPPEDASFLSRWSRRKRAAADLPAAEAKPDAELSPAPLEAEDESISEEELAALPSIEEFTPQTDIRPFLRKGVPRALRNAAMRKMWLLTPAIRDHADPAVDYAWDWNTLGGVPGDGAGPTLERAAEMLRDLVAPRHDAEPTKELEYNNNSPAEPRPPEAGSASGCDPAPAADHADDPHPDPVDSVAPGSEIIKEKQSEITGFQTRKRHGGAMPS